MKELLLDLDTNFRLSEDIIHSEFRKIKPVNENEVSFELNAELMAFSFVENYIDKNTGWGTYFGPMVVWPNKDGIMCESPSIRLVNSEVLDYWIKRMGDTSNPLMKARYSGLVWDFSKAVLDNTPDYKIGIIYTESLIDTVDQRISISEYELVLKLKRAAQIASSLNAVELLQRIKNEAIRLEFDMIDNEQTRLWGFSFDLLIGNKKIQLTDSEEAQILKIVEERFERLSNIPHLDPWAAEVQAERLASYFQIKGNRSKVKLIIQNLGKAFEVHDSGASSMQISSSLQHLYKIYTMYGLREEADLTLIKIRGLGPKMNEELQSFSSSVKIPEEKIERFLDFIIEGDINTIIHKVIQNFVPKKNQIKERMFEMAKSVPLTYLVSTSLQDSKGRVVATIGPLNDDMDGHLIHEISQSFSFQALLLRKVFKRLQDKKILTLKEIMSYIDDSPAFETSRLEIIKRGLEAYYNNDLIVAIHLLIPQIEDAVRNFIEFSGGIVLKSTRNGDGFQLKTLDELFRDDLILKVFGEDIQIYFRVLFTDQRGWNLRNDVCHGSSDVSSFSYQAVERIIHVLLILGTLRRN